MSSLLETAELEAFVRIVDANSLTRAAAELRQPRATVSRRLARLESHLGVRLLRRTTRSLALTDAGRTMYEHARRALDAVRRAEASIREHDGAVRGELRVSLPPALDDRFRAMLVDFVSAYPEVRLFVSYTSQHVDLLRGGWDVAIRATSALEPGLVARTLARGTSMLVGSPDYLARHGTPRRAADLREHRTLMGFQRGELPATSWPRVDGGSIAVEGSLYTNDLGTLVELALRGQGLALLPSFLVAPMVEAGRLEHVLGGVIGANVRVSVVYAERELVPPAVRAFIDATVRWAETASFVVPRPSRPAAAATSARKAAAANGARKAAGTTAPRKTAPAAAPSSGDGATAPREAARAAAPSSGDGATAPPEAARAAAPRNAALPRNARTNATASRSAPTNAAASRSAPTNATASRNAPSDADGPRSAPSSTRAPTRRSSRSRR